jgi:hypothetical protein
MSRSKVLFGSLVMTLAFATTAYADLIWPAVYLVGEMLAWWSIVTGLVVEYLFVRYLTGFSIRKSFIVDLAINLASSLLGVILIPIAGIIWEIFPGVLLYKVFYVGTFNPGTWAATFFFAVFINAFIENFVIKKFFKCKLGWRGFWWLSLANGLSVILCFISLYLNQKL